MGIMEDIGSGPVCLDTCLFIYFIEENKRYLKVIEPIFLALDEGHIHGVTSGISLLETLVIPLRVKDIKLADQYEKLFSESYGLTLVNLDVDILRRAAALRADFGIKTPDALQIAAALQTNCKAFITNDRRLPHPYAESQRTHGSNLNQ